MKKLLLTALACIIAASTFAAPIPISSLPFAITAPGTYVVTGNLTFSSPPSDNTVAAITVSTALSWPVVIDLRGFTLTGSGGNTLGVGIGVFANTSVPNTHPITVRNGTLQNFGFGVWAETGNQNNDITDLTVNNLSVFVSNGNGKSILFDGVDSSTVSNCIFQGGAFGIQDSRSKGGNTYNNDTFAGVNPLTILIGNGGESLVLSHCTFAPPAAAP